MVSFSRMSGSAGDAIDGSELACLVGVCSKCTRDDKMSFGQKRSNGLVQRRGGVGTAKSSYQWEASQHVLAARDINSADKFLLVVVLHKISRMVNLF